MKNIAFLFVFVSLAFGIFVSGCRDDETITGDGSKLSFSQDTLFFDTIFSTVGSTTAWLKIINRDNRKVVISNVSLKSGGTSGFRINLDGENGTSFKDVEIGAKDSIYLFVAITTPRQHSGKPVPVNDAVVFDSDGGSRQIVLKACSWDATIWRGKTITSDTILTNDKPYIIYDSLVVAKNATLTISEGTTLYFHDKAYFQVYGTVKADGTASLPVTMRGDRLDDVLTDLPYDNYPGQWYYVRLAGSSYNNEMNHVVIKGAYYGIIADSSSVDKPKLKLNNSVIHNMVYNCLIGVNCSLTIENSQLTNSGGYTVCLIGGDADVTHCTIANYQRLISRNGPALVLANYTLDQSKKEVPYPLDARFTNTIIYGTQSNEIGLSISENKTLLGYVFFKNCMLRNSDKLNSDISYDCVYTDDPHFLKLGTEIEKYRYDFGIDSISPARNKACVLTSDEFKFDMRLKSRYSDGMPDIGAYEY